jgi:hypothetical protein
MNAMLSPANRSRHLFDVHIGNRHPSGTMLNYQRAEKKSHLFSAAGPQCVPELRRSQCGIQSDVTVIIKFHGTKAFLTNKTIQLTME